MGHAFRVYVGGVGAWVCEDLPDYWTDNLFLDAGYDELVSVHRRGGKRCVDCFTAIISLNTNMQKRIIHSVLY